MSSHERQTPSRQNSLVKRMAGLTKSFSFNNKRGKPTSNHEADEQNVFCSDIVSREFILEKLKEVKRDRRITKVEIEDLLIASIHHSFLPMVKALLLSDKRDWKYLRFIDSVSADDYGWWEGMKFLVMREYETSILDASRYVAPVTFQANVELSKATGRKAVACLFKVILKDRDVRDFSFGGSLFGISKEHALGKLGTLFDKQDQLEERLVVNVTCGWSLHGRRYVRDELMACLNSLQQRVAKDQESEMNDDPLTASSRSHSTRSTFSSVSTHSTRSSRSSRSSRSQSSSQSQGGAKPQGRSSPNRSISLDSPRAGMVATTSAAMNRRQIPRTKSAQQERPSFGNLLSAKRGEFHHSTNNTSSMVNFQYDVAPTRPRRSLTNTKQGNQSDNVVPPQSLRELAHVRPPLPRSSSNRSVVKSTKVRRAKSLNSHLVEENRSRTKLPDDDWSSGDYVMSVAPSAA